MRAYGFSLLDPPPIFLAVVRDENDGLASALGFVDGLAPQDVVAGTFVLKD